MFKSSCLAVLLLALSFAVFADPIWTWADFYGSPSLDSAEDMVTDADGNVYFCGSFRDVMYFDASHSLTANPLSSQHMFLCKLDPLGNVLWVFQNTNTGSNTCVATSLALDAAGNVYMGGSYSGNMTLGGSTLNNFASATNAFFCKVSPEGSVIWIQGGGGTSFDRTTAVAVDPLGRPVFAGTFQNNATFGSFDLVHQGEQDIFAVKLDANGQWLGAKRYGGALTDLVEDMAINSLGTIYLTGQFSTATSFDSFSLSGYSGQSIFVAGLDSDLNTIWCTGAGGSGVDMAYALTLGSGQIAYITGQHSSLAVFGSATLPAGGFSGIFVAAVGPTGNWLWASSLGANSSLNNQGTDILRKADGDLIITGRFQGTISGTGYSLVSNGNFTDVFVARCSQTGAVKWAARGGSGRNDNGSSLAAYGSTGYYVYGSIFGIADFGDLSLSCGYIDLFLVILSDPGSAAPLSPAPLSISLQSGNRHLSWPAVTLDTEGQAVTGVSYKIYRATRPDFSDEILLSETAALTYLDTAPAANRYFYRVTANM